MRTRLLLGCLALALGALPAVAQEADSTGPKKPNRLFRDDRPMQITIVSDFKQLFKDRDTTKEERIAARLAYLAPEGESDTMAVELATRGHSRLQKKTCDFPPIRVYLPAKEERPRLFTGQGSLKLGVVCKPNRDEYHQYVLEEYLIYPTYNLFTDRSLRARLATATYIQEGSGDTVSVGPAFWIEDIDDLAARHGGEVFEYVGIRFGDVDQKTLATLGVFQYMIGNTDWALQVLHNIRVLKLPPGLYYPVPYDFDFSGIIKTPYAAPDTRLPIRSVRERLYRAACFEMEVFAPIIAEFQARKDAIYALWQDLPGRDPKRVEDSRKYLDDFYKVLENPGKLESEFRYICRG